MHHKKRWALVAGAVLIFICIFSCRKSETALLEEKALENLLSTDWTDREQGVHLLISLEHEKPSLDKKTGMALLNAFGEEMKRKREFFAEGKTRGRDSSALEIEFDDLFPRQTYGSFVATLATLLAQHRPKESLPILFQFLVESDYMVSPVLPVLYEEEGLKYLLEKASDGSEKEKKKAISILSLWVNPPQESEDWDPTVIPELTPQQKERVLPILVMALEMDDFYIVYCATSGLEPFRFQSAVKEKLVQLKTKHPDEDVRREAKRILEGVE